MKYVDLHAVEGTDPPVRIGRPVKRKTAKGKPISGRFYHELYTLGGRTVTKTLSTGNKKEAIRRVLDHQARRRRGEPGPITKVMSIGQGLDEWLEVSTNRGLAPTTIRKYDRVVRGLKSALGRTARQPLTHFTEREFWAFRKALADAGRDEATIYNLLTCVKQAFNYLDRNHRIEKNPLSAISLRKPDSKPQPVFTPAQVRALLDHADDFERPVFTFLAYTGCRFGEARDVEWTDIDFDRGQNGFVRIDKGGSRGKTKDKEARSIPLHPELVKVLLPMRQPSGRVFRRLPSKRHPGNDGSLNERSMLTRVKAMCRRCGFTNPDQYKLHTFRHAFASMHARAGTSYRYALELMGHSDSRILNIYYHIYDEELEKSIYAIDLRDAS